MLDDYRNSFTESRWEEICQLVREKGMKISYNDFTSREIQFIIDETPLNEEDRKGCVLTYVKRLNNAQISERMGYSESTIKYRKKRCSKLLRTTCCRIFK